MRLKDRLASLVVRQTALTVALVLAALVGFAATALHVIALEMRADLQRTVDTDVAGLADIAATGGDAELARRIADRLALQPVEREPLRYLLLDAAGRRLAGNMAQTRLDAARSEIGIERGLLLRATKVKGGATVVVGRSLRPLDTLAARLWRLALIGVAATVTLSLAAAALFAGRVGGRVARLNAAFDRFDDGDRQSRVAGVSGGDEIARLGRHVDRHLAKVERLFRTQRQISDDIAHELRTPLVHLDTRLLRALEHDLAPEAAEQLERARGDIRSVVSLCDALLDIALAESAVGAGAPGLHVDLSELASDLAELYAASAEEAGISLSARIAGGVAIRGEAMQLTRMIANLLDNAIKYVPAGGNVRLSLSAGPRLVIEDDGPGVPEADRELIFERFRRSAETGDGHGLGLALVRVIAARHGLSARAEDAGPGARFVVEPAAA